MTCLVPPRLVQSDLTVPSCHPVADNFVVPLEPGASHFVVPDTVGQTGIGVQIGIVDSPGLELLEAVNYPTEVASVPRIEHHH